MPRRIKKHLVNTRRRKHHGGGKKKGEKTLKKFGGNGNTRQRKHYGGSKKRRTTKRKVGGRSCSSLVNNKQGGRYTHDNHGPVVVNSVVVKEGDVFDVENFAKSVLPPPAEEDWKPAMGVIVPADADAARAEAARAEASRIKAAAEASQFKAAAEEAAHVGEGGPVVVGVVVVDNYDILIKDLISLNEEGNQIEHIYKKYLAPIKNSLPWNKANTYKSWTNTQLFWDFIKQEIINYGKNGNKSLRNFVEECLYRWNWKQKNCKNRVIYQKYRGSWADKWLAFDYEAVIMNVLGGVPVEEDDYQSSSELPDYVENAPSHLRERWERQTPEDSKERRTEANRPKFHDKADVKIDQSEWRDNYVRVIPKYNVERGYLYHVKYTPIPNLVNPDYDKANVVPFNDSRMKLAEYRLWLIFKACFEEYHKNPGKLSWTRRKRLKKLFDDAPAASAARETEAAAERARDSAESE